MSAKHSDDGRDRAGYSRREFIRVGAAGLGAVAATGALPAARAEDGPTPQRPAGPIHVTRTAGGQRHVEQPQLTWGSAGRAGGQVITLRPDRRAQEVLGFGAALTDAATYMLNQLSAEARAELLHDLYHPSAMGFSVGRTCIGSSDYSTVAYSYDESAEPDPELKGFSIAHDRQWILPMLREARAVNPDLWLLSSPWSPPGWMKDKNSLYGGTIRRRYLGAYAQYLTRYVQAYGAEGVRIDSITSQNEVDTDQDSRMPQCTWPQEIEVEFVGRNLGPAFEKAGVQTKIWLIDHNYNLWGRALAMLQDDDVRRYADGFAWHGYLGKPEEMTRVHNAHPDKHAYWTEGGPDVTQPDYQTDWTTWADTFTGILRNWARCIIAWNYALDEKGRPNVGPFSCGGVVTIDSGTRAITRSGQYWAFAHFSRHVRRGARVLESAGDVAGLSHVAFENPDGTQVLVLANAGKTVLQPRLALGGSRVQVELPADSVTTLEWKA